MAGTADGRPAPVDQPGDRWTPRPGPRDGAARARSHATPAPAAPRAGDHTAGRPADPPPRRPDGGGGGGVLRRDLWTRRRSRPGPYRHVLHPGVHAVVLLLRLPQQGPDAAGAGAV